MGVFEFHLDSQPLIVLIDKPEPEEHGQRPPSSLAISIFRFEIRTFPPHGGRIEVKRRCRSDGANQQEEL